MPSVKVYNQTGQEAGAVELSDKIFAAAPKKPAFMHEIVTALLSSKRQPLAATKTKGEVAGGGKKPWQQKGTGRARAGSIRSPLWRGGGITFGPRPERNFEKKLSRATKRQGLFAAFSDRAREGRIMAVEDLQIVGNKTKAAKAALEALAAKFEKPGKNLLVVVPPKRSELIRAMRNLPRVRIGVGDSVDILDILWAENIIILKAALDIIQKTYGNTR